MVAGLRGAVVVTHLLRHLLALLRRSLGARWGALLLLLRIASQYCESLTCCSGRAARLAIQGVPGGQQSEIRTGWEDMVSLRGCVLRKEMGILRNAAGLGKE